MKKHFFILLALCGAVCDLNAQAVFRHVTAAANTSAHITTLDHPQLNGNPNAMVFITTNWGTGGTGMDYGNNVGVWYNGSRWTIFNQNTKLPMPAGVTFNVMTVPEGTPGVFRHTVTAETKAANGFNNGTMITNPLTDGKDGIVLMATQCWTGTYNDNPIQVANTGGCGSEGPIKWVITNGATHWNGNDFDKFPMPVGASFNVMVIENSKVPGFSTASAFAQVAKPETIIPAGTHISFFDHPDLNAKPDAMVFVTPFWGRGTICTDGPYVLGPTSVWYDHPQDAWKHKEGYWSVYYGKGTPPMPNGAKFNVVVVPANVQYFSPLGASPGGPSGPATNKLTVKPYCCPSTALEISATSAINENDLQWVNIPLDGIIAGPISSVTVCYQVMGAGDSYISQVRLTEMTTPDKAMVMLDDPTDLKSKSVTCYTAKTNYSIKGTATLALRIVLAPGGKINIGGISIER